MASIGHFKSVAIAEESTYASVASGAVDASGLTYVSFDCEATLTSLPTDGGADDDVSTRDRAGRRAPLPSAAYDSANSRWKQRGEGSFTLTGYYDPPDSGTNYDSTAIGIILGTAFAKLTDPGSVSEQVAGSSGANILTATDASLYTPGAVIGHTLAGKFRYAQVTSKTGTAITHSPVLNGSGLAINDVVRFCRTYYIPAPGEATDVESFAVRLDAAGGMRFYAVGCVLDGAVEFTETEGGRLKFSFSISSPYIYADHGNAALDAVDFSSEVYASRYNAPIMLSDAVAGATAPHSLGREDLEPSPGTVKITLECQTTRSGFWADGVPYRIRPVTVEPMLEFAVDDISSTIANDFEARNHRHWLIPYGPQIAGAGVCFFVPRGHLMQSAANRDAPEGGTVQQTIQIRPGFQYGINASTNVAKSPMVIGLGL